MNHETSWTTEKIKSLIHESMIEAINNPVVSSEQQSQNQNGWPVSLDSELQQMALLAQQNNLLWNITAERDIRSHRRMIGRAIIFLKKVIRKFMRWYINPVVEQQRAFNANIARTTNSIEEIIINLDTLVKEATESCYRLDGRLSKTDKQVTGLANFQTSITESINQIVDQRIQALETQIVSRVYSELEHIKLSLASGDANWFSLVEQVARIERRIRNQPQISSLSNAKEHAVADQKALDAETTGFEFDYFMFEQKYRGSRQQIKERQKHYLQFLSHAKNIIDIGCGRGEFLELMTEENKNVRGIDIDPNMVDYCRDRGFAVEQIDILSFLRDLPPNSVDAVFMAQVVEHLDFDTLTEAVYLIRRSLRPTGVYIAETVNVESVMALSNWFYMDPTHVKPVHPETLTFLLKSAGFANVQREYLNSPTGVALPPLISSGIENLQEFNSKLERLNSLVFGHLDYALIATK